ncbi:hypothetical protein IPdc08_00821 [archaeon]|nr:hypothetical protein IPdc08_00821 [archaeon]
MKEIIKKIGLLGIGLAALTEEKVREIIEDLENKGEISKEDGKAFVKEVIKARKKQKVELEKTVAKEVEKAFKTAGIATKKDIEEIIKEIESIKAK